MEMTPYRLPSGEVVMVDATAAKGAATIGFTLKGGEVVEATLWEPTEHLHRLTVWVRTSSDYTPKDIEKQVIRSLSGSRSVVDGDCDVEHVECEPVFE